MKTIETEIEAGVVRIIEELTRLQQSGHSEPGIDASLRTAELLWQELAGDSLSSPAKIARLRSLLDQLGPELLSLSPGEGSDVRLPRAFLVGKIVLISPPTLIQ